MSPKIQRYLDQLRRYYKVKRLLYKGWTYGEIAKRFGVSRQRIGIIAKRTMPPQPFGVGSRKNRPKCRECRRKAVFYGRCAAHFAKKHGIVKW